MTHWAIKLLKGFAIFVLFLLLSLTIFGASTIFIADKTVLNPDVYQKQMNDNNGYAVLSAFFSETLSQAIINSSNQTSDSNTKDDIKLQTANEGIKQQLAQAFSPDKLKAQLEPQIKNLFDYINSKTNTLTISFDLKEFKQSMLDYYSEKGVDVSESISKIPDTYTISQTGDGADLYVQLTTVRDAVSVMHIIFYILLVLTVVFLFLLYLLYRPNWKKFMSQTGINILVDGLVCLIALLIIKSAAMNQNIGLAPGLPSEVVTLALGFLEAFINAALFVFIVITIIGLGLLIGSFFVKTPESNIKEKQKQKQEPKRKQ